MMGRVSGCAIFFAAVLLPAADCSRTSTGLLPLSDPFFVYSYEGARGGLYADGSSRRPPAHEAAGLRLAAQIRPIDGRIVLLSVGMSNTTQEFSAFQQLAARDRNLNPQLTLVDGAQGGWSADRIVSNGAEYWSVADQRLRTAGATGAQVQVVWMKQADATPTLRFPEDARRLQSELAAIARTLRSRFPNLRLLYLSSRIYAGYASTRLNPEPYAYQSGFAVKWLLERQLQGEQPDLPWMSWGPYLWADGLQARADGLRWDCSDFEEDGTHPSPSGRRKVAAMLLDFFKTDPTARPWFLRPVSAGPVPAPAAVVNAASFAPQVAPGSIATLFGSELANAAAGATGLPLPLTLAGASVEIDGLPAPLLYVSPRQINLLLPRNGGEAAVVVRDGVRSAPLLLRFAFWAPGLFTLDGSGRGPAAALHADGRPITSQNPARRGESIMLFGTGSGFRDPRMRLPEILPSVLIGGVSSEVEYSGPAPGFSGLDQVNVQVPNAAPLGSAVPVELRYGAAASNTATLAVGPGSSVPPR
jgi:uncharacterized protein (TIGR03437 family)